MGVKTILSLDELNQLFTSYKFTSLQATTHGIVDTTYIASTKDKDYIIKKYERDISKKVDADIELLDFLKINSLNVPKCIDASGAWYIYEKLAGTNPRLTQTYHIQALVRFMAKMHTLTYKKDFHSFFYESYEVPKLLKKLKKNHFAYYKKLSFLHKYRPVNDGIIHGDIFKDNTVFDGETIGVFDFIDSGCGSFVFDLAVSLIGFDIKKNNKYFINLALKTYNQKAPVKISLEELLLHITIASQFYTLLRIEFHNSTHQAKELL